MGLLDYIDEDSPLFGGLFGNAKSLPPSPTPNASGGDISGTLPALGVDATGGGFLLQGQTSPALPQWLQTAQDPSRSAPPVAGLTQAQFNDRSGPVAKGSSPSGFFQSPAPSAVDDTAGFDGAKFDPQTYAGRSVSPSWWEHATYENPNVKGFGKKERPSAESMSLAQTLVPYFIAAESEGNPTAKNKGSTATGTGQFIKGTWLDLYNDYLGLEGGGKYPNSPRRMNPGKDRPLLAERTDPQRSHQMLLLYTGQNIDKLKHEGFEPTPRNAYLAHFLGPDGAIAALSADPSSPVSQVLSKNAIGVNPPLQGDGKTIKQVIDWADQYISKKQQGVDQRNKRNGYRLAPAAPIAFPDISSQIRPARNGTIDLSKLQNTLKTSGNPIIFLGR